MPSTLVANGQLRQAGELAQQGRVDDAMRIYRQLYGDHPPDGDIALAYYKTLYGTSTGKADAIAAMRALAERNPGDQRYAVQLGIMLTYDQRTRAEGIRILEAHPADLDAQAGLRQALMWDSANPASAAELREFLKAHPQDRRARRPSETERIEAGADELRHCAHARRARGLCGPQRAPARRGGEALYRSARAGT